MYFAYLKLSLWLLGRSQLYSQKGHLILNKRCFDTVQETFFLNWLNFASSTCTHKQPHLMTSQKYSVS